MVKGAAAQKATDEARGRRVFVLVKTGAPLASVRLKTVGRLAARCEPFSIVLRTSYA